MIKALFTGIVFSCCLFLAGGVQAQSSIGSMILSESAYVCTKGLAMVSAENAYEVYGALIEKASDSRTNTDIRTKIVEKLATIPDEEALSSLITISQNTAHEFKKSSEKIPLDIMNAKDFSSLETAVKKYATEHFPHYPLLFVSGSPLLNLGDILKEKLTDETPATVQMAVLINMQKNAVNHISIADELLELSKSDLAPVRALAYRAIALKFPSKEVTDFIKDGLSDKSIIVRATVISAAKSVLPPGLEPHLAAALRNESDPDTYKKIGEVIEAYENTYLVSALTDFCSVIFVLILIGIFCSIPLILRWQKQMKLKLGIREIRRSNFKKAGEILTDIADTIPALAPRARIHLARVYLRENDVKKATDIIKELNLPSHEIEDLYELACDLDGKSLKAGAARVYLNILEKNQEFKDVQDRFNEIDIQFGGGRDDSKVSASGTTNMTDLAKKLLSKEYSSISMIGKGGMGAVFKAKSKQTGEVSAIKILAPHLADDESLKTRFYRESVAIANLSHENICKVRDIRKAELPFIVMEFIDGSDLKSIIKNRETPFELDEFYSIAMQVVDGLALAHSKHIVHRDIKPENLLLTKDGIPKIIDFGLVKFKENSSEITATGAMMGTPKYMSPEQIKGEADVGAQTDIFSIGMVFYEMLSLKYPFPKDAVFQRVFMEPMPLRPHNPKVTAQLESIILKCMQRHAVERFENAQELKSMLEISRDF